MSRNLRPLRTALFPALALTVALIAGPAAAFAQESEDAPPPRRTAFLGLSFAGYQVADPVYELVYGKGGLMKGLVFGQALAGSDVFDLSLVLEARNLSKTGASTVSQQETVLSLTPLSVGLAGSLTRGVVSLWADAGLDLFLYSEKSPLQITSGSTLGFHLGGGLVLDPLRTRVVRLKLHIRWTKATATVEEIPVSIGGAEYGASLMFGFRLFGGR